MRTWMRHSLLLLAAALLTPVAASITPAFAIDDAAHSLAQRFSGDTGSGDTNTGTGNGNGNNAGNVSGNVSGTQTEDQREAEEAEILERARNEAAEHDAELKRAEAERIAEKNRADELKHQADAAKAAQDAELERKASEQAEAAKLQDAAAQEQLAREREVSDLAQKLKRVRDARPAGEMGLGVPPQEPTAPDAISKALEASTNEPESSAKESALPQTDAVELDDRRPSLPPESVRNATSVTVLLVMEPGTTGIRRGSKTADPVLCLDNWCYVSTGTETPAKLMSRGAALGPINTLGLRAGACRQSLTCIYRGLDIAAYFKTGTKPASLQPVDLRYLHHDRRQPMPLAVDSNCSASANSLHCASAIKGQGWTAWIVPEEMAVNAGTGALQAALAGGLVVTGTAAHTASVKFSR